MSRAQRLLDLIQELRRHRRPVQGSVLAEAIGVSLRTLYRDIATLKAQGAPIDGEAGLGYVLRPGFLLPPLMFSDEEIEALVLGSRWVAKRTDGPLAAAARSALAKIGAVLPDDLRDDLESANLLIGPSPPLIAGGPELALLRRAIRLERKLDIAYVDAGGGHSTRRVWPFALGFFEQVRMLAAWCEERRDFRHFRLDRIETAELVDQRYPRRKAVLLKEWRDRHGFPEQ
ncbi:helix-turn-helix transcriptional regulator [Zavarzinia sp.]|uniref:helix-turn-helix transcriptional regulator n=1 Tax=Zavarzinia sp. TaxID=2027920 RepID=UPI00356A83DF